MTIVGTDPIEKENTQPGDTGPEDFEKPGPHRYIGIGMVIGLAVIIFILWVSVGRWPREKMRAWGWLKQKPESEESGVKGEKPRFVDEIILPKEPEKAKERVGQEHRGSRREVASWEADIDYKVSWEMKQHAYFEPGRIIIPPNRTDYMPPERRSRRSR
ncbi:hypothetical protein H0H87_003850 [Tephrocybe sp. NHM501043]|nr:hypothetical protein H0H87_003850 [Tephrocybe sp. NHM501043]